MAERISTYDPHIKRETLWSLLVPAVGM